VLRGKFIPINAYIWKTKISQTNSWIMHLNLLEIKEQTNSKTSRQREMIKDKAKINKIETEQTTENQWNKKLVLWND
jgi:hypothetical protein